MNEHYKKLWIEALRSGKYQQGQGALKDDDGFHCCLGVIANEVSCDNWTKETNYYYNFTYNGIETRSYGTLPHTLLEFLGLEYFDQGQLIGMNDSGKTFAEIADWIEGNL